MAKVSELVTIPPHPAGQQQQQAAIPEVIITKYHYVTHQPVPQFN